LSKKRHPRVLFIPTASSDSQTYWKRFQEYFGTFLRCKTDVLFLSREASKERVREKIFSTDVIYVGGGNTLHMMRIWRRRGVDRLLLSAYKRGTVLSGISAGAICWFESGHSDSMSFYNPRKWEYSNVNGLGLIKGIHCPHYNGRTRGVARRRDFRTLIERTRASESPLRIIARSRSSTAVFIRSYARKRTQRPTACTKKAIKSSPNR
jgi:dipeptidase E